MMQVPTSWIYALNDPVKLMADWDLAADLTNDLMGFPHDRGRETIYTQVDVLIRSGAYAPGYPAVNNTYTPGANSNGYSSSYLVRGPQFAPDYATLDTTAISWMMCDTLVHYKSLVPSDNATFRTFANSWWGHQPLTTGYEEENNHARRWGLNPTSSASFKPISIPLERDIGSIRYTRRNPVLTGASYRYEWSSTLATNAWTSFTPAAESLVSSGSVETVTVTFDAGLLARPSLFVRVVASQN